MRRASGTTSIVPRSGERYARAVAPAPELVYHDFREEADFALVRAARDAGAPFRKIELDLLLTESGLGAPARGIDPARAFSFARDEGFELFIHLVDESVYTDLSLGRFRERLARERALGPGTIVGSTHLAGLLRVKAAIREVENQGRFPVPGIHYVHKFGADLLRVIARKPGGFDGTAAALETLFGVEIPAPRRPEYEAMALIASFDAIDKRSGRPAPLGPFLEGAARLAALPVLDLLITNALKRADALRHLAALPFRR